MAVNEGQLDLETGQVHLVKIGSFTAKDNIISAEQVHTDLAVKTPDLGPEKTHVQDFEIKAGTRVQESVVGKQVGTDGNIYVGGGNQVEPLIASTDRKNILTPIGPARELPKTKAEASVPNEINAHSSFGTATSQTNNLKLRVDLTLQDKGILNSSGHLTQQAIDNSSLALKPGQVLKYPPVVEALTKDGSKITDWQKLTTETVEMSTGQRIQAHYYHNTKTQKVDYTYGPDFKVKNPVPVVPKAQLEPSVKPYDIN
ncbi:MAG: hypothetical protein HRU20_27265 [Pseudomonadales bacterium]|nr:hypothetical protein [Pseudomonadales bacterium]